MGRSLPLKVNPKRLEKSKQGDCMEELQAFFTCMTRAGPGFDEKCAAQRAALTECASAAAKKPKVRSTINHHLQRLSRALKMR